MGYFSCNERKFDDDISDDGEGIAVCGRCDADIPTGTTREYCLACYMRDAISGDNYLTVAWSDTSDDEP